MMCDRTTAGVRFGLARWSARSVQKESLLWPLFYDGALSGRPWSAASRIDNTINAAACMSDACKMNDLIDAIDQRPRRGGTEIVRIHATIEEADSPVTRTRFVSCL